MGSRLFILRFYALVFSYIITLIILANTTEYATTYSSLSKNDPYFPLAASIEYDDVEALQAIYWIQSQTSPMRRNSTEFKNILNHQSLFSIEDNKSIPIIWYALRRLVSDIQNDILPRDRVLNYLFEYMPSQIIYHEPYANVFLIPISIFNYLLTNCNRISPYVSLLFQHGWTEIVQQSNCNFLQFEVIYLRQNIAQVHLLQSQRQTDVPNYEHWSKMLSVVKCQCPQKDSFSAESAFDKLLKEDSKIFLGRDAVKHTLRECFDNFFVAESVNHYEMYASNSTSYLVCWKLLSKPFNANQHSIHNFHGRNKFKDMTLIIEAHSTNTPMQTYIMYTDEREHIVLDRISRMFDFQSSQNLSNIQNQTSSLGETLLEIAERVNNLLLVKYLYVLDETLSPSTNPTLQPSLSPTVLTDINAKKEISNGLSFSTVLQIAIPLLIVSFVCCIATITLQFKYLLLIKHKKIVAVVPFISILLWSHMVIQFLSMLNVYDSHEIIIDYHFKGAIRMTLFIYCIMLMLFTFNVCFLFCTRNFLFNINL